MNTNLTASILISLSVCTLMSSCSMHPTEDSPHYEPGLGEIMSLTSMRHAKLWFAGQGKNWPLAEYELEELREGFEDAGKFHPTHRNIAQPIPELIASTMDGSLTALETTLKTKNSAQFTQHFDAVTAGCNACHQLTAFEFNRVTRPTSNTFSNQAFSQ